MREAILATITAAAIAVIWSIGDPPLQPLDDSILASTIGGAPPCYKENNRACPDMNKCSDYGPADCLAKIGWKEATPYIQKVLLVFDDSGTHQNKLAGDTAYCHDKYQCRPKVEMDVFLGCEEWFTTGMSIPETEEVVANPECLHDVSP